MMNNTNLFEKLRRQRLAWMLVLSAVLWGLGVTVEANPVIHEINYHPAPITGNSVEPVQHEFIELANPTEETLDLSGYRFTSGIRYVFAEGVALAPGDYLVVAADPNALLEFFPDLLSGQVFGPWVGALSNSGERIQLEDPTGREVDEVWYADQGDWADRRESSAPFEQGGWQWETKADGGGRSLELLDVYLPNDLGQNWRPSFGPGTPGAVNNQQDDHVPPMIDKVRHSPIIPTAKDSVEVRARMVARDLSGLAVSLHWRSTSDEFLVVDMAPESEGSSTYVGTIPPQEDKTVVEFYVRASDGAETRTWPGPTTTPSIFNKGDQKANALYQVDNERFSGSVYHLIMTPTERRSFDTLDRQSDRTMNATLIAIAGDEGEVRYRCGVRFRGNSSRSYNPPPKRVTIPRDTPLWGESSINLNSRNPHNQLVGNMLFAAAGLVSPEVRFVEVRENGQSLRPHVHVLPYGSEFVDKHFPGRSMGNLYRKRSASGNRSVKRWGVHTESFRAYRNPRWYEDDEWDKVTNASADDWSDLQHFVETMDQADASSPDYLNEVHRVSVPEQWVRWFAIMTLLNNTETNLSNGIDDDYAMIANEEGRFLLLPHDLDSLFSSDTQATLFPMIDESVGGSQSRIPQLEPFFATPQMLSAYYAALRQLLESVFAKESFDQLVTVALKGTSMESRSQSMINFMDARREFVRGILATPLAFRATAATIEHESKLIDVLGMGGFNQYARVTVNGVDAQPNGRHGDWEVRDLALSSGMNVVTLRAYDEGGHVRETLWKEIHVKSEGEGQQLRGVVSENATWRAEEGPYRITEDLLVSQGVHLEVESGTSVSVEPGVTITIAGSLHVAGSPDRRVRFGPPGLSVETWGGLRFLGAASDKNELESVDFVGLGAPIQVEQSEVRFVDVRVTEASGLAISSQDSHLEVVGSRFQGSNGVGIIKAMGSSDAEDAVSLRDNVFVGMGGTLIELEVPAVAVGNTFTGASLAVSSTAKLTLAHNTFTDFERVAETTGELLFQQNTAVGVQGMALTAASGLVMDNLFWDVSQIVQGVPMRRNLLPDSLIGMLSPEEIVSNLLVNEPGFRQGALVLAPYAPGQRAGSLAQPVGALADRRAVVRVHGRGESAKLTLSGAPWVVYEWLVDDATEPMVARVDDGRQSTMVIVEGLTPGQHTVQVRGQDASGYWQEDPTTVTWEAHSGSSPIIIQEVFLRNQSALAIGDRFPDAVELYNAGETAVDLSGYRVRDSLTRESAFVFPPNTVVESGEVIVVYGGEVDRSRLDLHWLGFSLSEGETLTLSDGFGNMIDQVDLGHQLVDHAIHRQIDGRFQVGLPTLGVADSRRLVLGDPRDVVVNEWLTVASVSFREDFIELYNPSELPIDLGGFRVTDTPDGSGEVYVFAEPTLLPARGFLVLDEEKLPFGLAARADWIVLKDGYGEVLDNVFIQGMEEDRAWGRVPDGSGIVLPLTFGTPGLENYVESQSAGEELFSNPVNFETPLRYHGGDHGGGRAWREVSFDDASWMSGAGFFGDASAFDPGSGVTPLESGSITHYFRVPFLSERRFRVTDGSLYLIANSGAIAYLNGHEIGRLRMPLGEVSADALALHENGMSGYELLPFADVELLAGENVLAVEFHQATSDSMATAAAMFLSLRAEPLEESAGDPRVNYGRLLTSLRITEIMFAPDPSHADAEYLELMNIGDEALDLSGVRFTNGIDYVFPEGTLLNPRSFVLVVKDIAAFQAAYGENYPVAGVYDGRLSNGGERVELSLPEPYDVRILSFTYDNQWVPLADGGGHSLTVDDVVADRSRWDEREGWIASSQPGGNPGNNGPPSIVGNMVAAGTQADPFSYQVQATNFATRFEAVGLPDGLALDEASGWISGQSWVFGRVEVVLTAFNPAGASDSRKLVLDFERKLPPEITNGLSLERMAFQETRFPIEGTNLPQSYAAEGLPAGLRLDAGVISGFPEEIGVFPIAIEATNFAGTATATLELTVTESVIGETLGVPNRVFRLGDVGWRADGVNGRNGGESLVNARRVMDGGTLWLETSVVGPDVVTFWWRAQLKGGAASMDVRLGFEQVAFQGNDFDWEYVRVVVPEGEHVLRWAMRNFSETNPLLFLDDVRFASDSKIPLVYNDSIYQANHGSPISFPILATGEPTVYSLRDGPAWLVVDAATGMVSGTPPTSQDVSVVLVASNAEGSGEQFVEIIVNERFDISRAVLTPGLIFRTGGDRPWRSDPFISVDGNGALVTSGLDDDEFSWFETVVEGPGELAFSWQVGSEECCDRLGLRVDGNTIADVGGVVDWERFTTRIASGRHEVRWEYRKDGSVAENGDRARVDAIQWTPDMPDAGGFAGWIAQFSGLSGQMASAEADPDADGLSNLVEYAFDLKPHVFSGLPHVWARLGRDEVMVQIEPLVHEASLRVILEVSNDLTMDTWQAVTEPQTLSTSLGTEISVPLMSDQSRVFVRLRLDGN